MEFELSEELSKAILFSMENQDDSYVLDSVEKRLEKKADFIDSMESVDSIDSERYYPLPVWDSVRGYTLMEQFTAILHNPLAREELRSALASGKGVFRQFKNILKTYPEVERLWFSFKENQMRHTIIRWYNSLRDLWGLEHIGDEPEETEDIVHDDFIFREYGKDGDDSAEIREKRDTAYAVIEGEIQAAYTGDLGAAFAGLWKVLRGIPGGTPCGSGTKCGAEHSLVVETNSGDFAGSVTACAFPEETSDTALVTAFFVLPLYRGLGLGRELLDMLIELLNRERFRWIIWQGMFLPQEFIQVLLQRGFKLQGTMYIFDLVENT
ncbi:MAG: GNAT family N-acetyltransferase [Spirochaetaceae bacterium]|jgi:GNAT superfamily N-acetyltransferase|nr:GNAT family N-acetyltransferase [Spirochaetaceae bacterium]